MAKRPTRTTAAPPPVPTQPPATTPPTLTAEQQAEYNSMIEMGMSEADAMAFVSGAPNPVDADGKAKATVIDTTNPATTPAGNTPPASDAGDGAKKPHEGKNAPSRNVKPEAVAVAPRTPMAGRYPQDISQMPTIDEINGTDK